MEDIVIREARREDCPEIMRLVKELADFEHMPDGPKIGADVLQRDGFDNPNPLFKCFVAHTQSQGEGEGSEPVLIGYALFYYTYSTWMGSTLYLEDLYVTSDFRDKKLGSALFDKVVKTGYESGCCRMYFIVLKWNPAAEFYKRKGAIDVTADEDWHYYRLEKDAMAALANK